MCLWILILGDNTQYLGQMTHPLYVVNLSMFQVFSIITYSLLSLELEHVKVTALCVTCHQETFHDLCGKIRTVKKLIRIC